MKNIWLDHQMPLRWLFLTPCDFLPGLKTTIRSLDVKPLQTLLPSQRRLSAPLATVCWCQDKNNSKAPSPDQHKKDFRPGTVAEKGSTPSSFLGRSLRRRKTYHHHSLVVWIPCWTFERVNEIKSPIPKLSIVQLCWKCLDMLIQAKARAQIPPWRYPVYSAIFYRIILLITDQSSQQDNILTSSCFYWWRSF